MGKKAARLEILNGWKEIASYPKKSVRTAQRYERVLGLPIRRPAGKSVASIVAKKVELDAWIAAAPLREQFQRTTATIDNTSLLNELRLNTERLYQLNLKSEELRKEMLSSLRLLRENTHLASLESDQFNHVPLTRTPRVLMFRSTRKVNQIRCS